jgi:hypothetical protein
MISADILLPSIQKQQILAWCDDVLVGCKLLRRSNVIVLTCHLDHSQPQPPLSARAVTPDNSETGWDRVEMVMERPHKLRVELEGARVHVKPLEF